MKIATNEVFVSVIIPTYNRRDTIVRSVTSVLHQTHHNLEVIVVDDQSDDDTLSLLEAINDERIRVIALPDRAGAPHARNVGVQNSRSEYIAFHDSDDIWLHDKIDKQLTAMVGPMGGDVCFCQLIQVYSSGVRLIPSFFALPEDLYGAILQSSIASTQTLVMTRAIFDLAGGFDESLQRLQDWDLVVRLANISKIAYLPEPLAIAFETPGSLTSYHRKGIDAREAMIKKNFAIFLTRPVALSRQYYVMASMSFKYSDYDNASVFAKQSILMGNRGLKNILLLLISTIFRLVQFRQRPTRSR